MNKSDLINSVAEKANITKKVADKVVNQVFSVIEDSLANNEKVQIVGFGTFEVKERAERIGRNPQTKESIIIPAAKVPVFKAGKVLKNAVQ